MSAREHESNITERVARLEAENEAVIRTLDGIQQEMRGIRQDIRDLSVRMDSRFDAMYGLMSTWLKWVLGFVLSSWLTLMVSIWLKR